MVDTPTRPRPQSYSHRASGSTMDPPFSAPVRDQAPTLAHLWGTRTGPPAQTEQEQV